MCSKKEDMERYSGEYSSCRSVGEEGRKQYEGELSKGMLLKRGIVVVDMGETKEDGRRMFVERTFFYPGEEKFQSPIKERHNLM